MNIRLYNASILTMEKGKEMFEGEIWIKNDRIALIASDAFLREARGEASLPRCHFDIQLDCEKNLLMPGFKNAHTHSPMVFLRSYADELPLDTWLHKKIFPAEEKLTDSSIYEFTRLAVLEYLANGITSIFDMYICPEAVAEACIDTGMRCSLVSGLNDFTSSPEQMEEEYLKYNKIHPLISYQMGFHAEYTCRKELLYQVSQLVHKYHTPVYMHLSETEREVLECKRKYGMSPVVFLDSLGLLEFGGGGFHCVHVSDEDMEVLRRRRVHVITNPSSNLKLASGIAPIEEFMNRRIPVSIGTDGAASNNSLNLFKEMYLVSALGKQKTGNAAAIPASKVLRMATVHGAKAMGLSKCDTLAKGKQADIIMIDLQKPNMQPIHNLVNNLVYSGNTNNVKMTMIAGKILYYNGEYNIGIRPAQVYENCNRELTNMQLGEGK